MRLNWFGDTEHRVFNYKPMYDKDNNTKEDSSYVPGTLLQGAFRDGNYAKRKSSGKLSKIISIIGMILFFAILFMIAKFFQII